MGWVLGLGNGIVFRQGGSQNWSSYWTNLNKPSDVTTQVIDGGVRVSWIDNSGGVGGFQVWVTDNGVKYTQVGTDVAAGVTTLDHITANPLPLTYKVRGVKNGYYSDFTSTATQITCLAYYPIDRHYIGGAGNVKDKSGNTYHLTAESGTIRATNKNSIIYSAVSFDGSNDQIRGEYPDLCLAGEMTLTMWINADDLVKTQYLACSINAAGGAQNFGFLLGLTDNRLTVLWGGSVIATSSTDIGTVDWIHVGFKRSGVTGAWTATIYLNGSPDGTGNSATNPSSVTTNKIAIGADPTDSISTEFDGILDDVRIYNRALSDTAIAAIAAYSVDADYHVFTQTVFTDASLAILRTTLLGLIFPGGVPATGKKSITLDVADPLTTSPANLASVDEVVVEVTGIADRTCYVWHPTAPNGKFVIHHVGHWKTAGNAFEPAGMGDLTRALVEAGYTVCHIPMPPGATGEGDIHDGMGYDGAEDLELFLTTPVKILNEYAGQFSAFYMTGLSGGGWTTDLMCALDTRITKGAPVADGLPYYVTQSVPLTRDFEQQLIGLIANVDYADLFLMACTGGRKYKKYLNDEDPTGFNQANYNLDPFAPAINAITDNFELVWDVNNAHEISAGVTAQIVAFFNT